MAKVLPLQAYGEGMELEVKPLVYCSQGKQLIHYTMAIPGSQKKNQTFLGNIIFYTRQVTYFIAM